MNSSSKLRKIQDEQNFKKCAQMLNFVELAV